MKKLKLRAISSLIAAALVFPAAVHAEGTTTDASKLGNGLIKEQQRIQLVQEKQQYKTEFSQKKDTIKKNHETNQGLRKTAADKRAAVKSAITDIKQSKKQLTAEDLTKVQDALNVVQGDVSALEATKSTIKQAFEQFKTDVQSKNFDAAASQLDNVITIQNTRTSALTKLSSDLDSLLNILQTAAANSSTAQAPQTGA